MQDKTSDIMRTIQVNELIIFRNYMVRAGLFRDDWWFFGEIIGEFMGNKINIQNFCNG
jgi:hypothetical protein